MSANTLTSVSQTLESLKARKWRVCGTEGKWKYYDELTREETIC